MGRAPGKANAFQALATLKPDSRQAPREGAGNAAPLPTPSLANDDLAAFQAAMAGATPLAKDDHAHLERPKPEPRPIPRAIEKEPVATGEPLPRGNANDPWELFRSSIGEVTPIKDTGRADLGPRPAKPRYQAHTARPDAEIPTQLYLPNLPDNDPSALFRSAAGPARPLADKNQAALNRPLPPARPLPQPVETTPLDLPGLSDRPQGDDTSSYLRPGAPRRLLADLRRGRWQPLAELDLHGLTRDEARYALGIFLARHQSADRRCLRLIHGKGLSSPGGEPLLRNLTRSWLSQHPEVLAFCEARPQDGGSGALLVLLRNPLKVTNKMG